mgnify:CR=1 FL=1
MEIKVLGTGCAKCKTTYQTIEKVISENNLEDVKTYESRGYCGNTQFRHYGHTCRCGGWSR